MTGPDDTTGGSGWKRLEPLYPLIPILLAAAVYLRTTGHDAVLLDDDLYLLSPVVRGGLSLDGVARAFTSFEASNWHPLAWISHMVDLSIFGLARPGAHHLVSAALHGTNALLFFLFLRDAAGAPGKALFAASLFAVHPVHVESVAWIAERKDVLSGLFFLLALHGWRRYAAAPSPGRYGAAAAAFALSLLSKPMAVTLPFVLLLLDGWPLGRTSLAPPADGSPWHPLPAGRLLLEKAPLLLLSAASSAVTVAAQRAGGAVRDLAAVPAGERLANALTAYPAYLGKLAWPANLAVLYPQVPVPPWKAVAAALFLAAATAAVLAGTRRRPYLPAGWFWFLGMVVPVLGLVQAGAQSMADRYAYLPFLGLYVVAAWGAPELLGRLPGRDRLLPAAGSAVVAAFAAAAFVQAGHWKDSEALFRRTLAVTGPNPSIELNLAIFYDRTGREAEALEGYRAAARLRPDSFDARVGVASVLLRAGGDPAEASGAAEAALALRPGSAFAARLAGESQERLGRRDVAAALYRRALSRDPGDAAAREGLARVAPGSAP